MAWYNHGMDIELTTRPTEVVRVFLNGRLVTEVAAGMADTRDTLVDELLASRAARNAMRILATLGDVLHGVELREDHVNATPAKKRAAAIDGIVDGLAGKTKPHPFGDGVPSLLPRSDPAYGVGYEWGESISRSVALEKESSALEL